MPNNQTSVPLFATSQILTAANMNISAGTGVPVFTNATTRDAAFGGAGEKILDEGQMAYLMDNNQLQFYDGSTWAGVGLSLKSQVTAITSALSLPASSFNTFTNTNYRVIFQVNTPAAATHTLRLRFGGVDDTTANYDYAGVGLTYAGATFNLNGSAATSIALGNSVVGNTTSFVFDILSPIISGRRPSILGSGTTNTAGNVPGSLTMNAQNRLTTGFDSMTFTSSASQSMTAYCYAYQGIN